MNIKGGINIKANTADLVSQLKAAGVQGGAALKASLDAVLQQAGVGKAERVKIEASVQGVSQVQQLKQEIAQLHDKEVTAKAHGDASEVKALNAQIAALHDKLITITTVVRQIGVGVSMGTPTLTTPGALGIGHAAGFLVPGTGSGDHMPALLEPGEAVVPKFLVPLIAPILKSHHVPGFQSGGIVTGPGGFSFSGGGSLAAEFAAGLKQWAADIAKQTASQITTSVNYARGVSSAALAGQGYGTQGLISGFNVGTGGPSGVGAAPPGPRGTTRQHGTPPSRTPPPTPRLRRRCSSRCSPTCRPSSRSRKTWGRSASRD